MKRALAVLLIAAPATAAADQVFVKGGGRINGVVVERTAAAVVIEVGAGRVTLPADRVERIVEGVSPLAVYRERAGRLRENDASGWLQLAFWARDQGLLTQARDAFERVLLLDPANPAAHRALGDVPLGERWVTPEESYRARGYVLFEGSWVTPEEREGTIRERAARAEAAVAERARAEAEARAREAEARARTAEAEARRAEYGPQGIPFYGGLVSAGFVRGGFCCASPFLTRPPQPMPAVVVIERPLPPAPPPAARNPGLERGSRARLPEHH